MCKRSLSLAPHSSIVLKLPEYLEVIRPMFFPLLGHLVLRQENQIEPADLKPISLINRTFVASPMLLSALHDPATLGGAEMGPDSEEHFPAPMN